MPTYTSIEEAQKAYTEAKAKGDTATMADANAQANQMRGLGYTVTSTDDIAKTKAKTGTTTTPATTPVSYTTGTTVNPTTAQIKEMQTYYGTTADGIWGKNSTAAAGGLSAADAWAKYQNRNTGTTATTPTTKTVSYIDADGNKKTGYVINDLTYTDAAGKNRIGVGSSVQTDDGTWYTLTDKGGQKASDADSKYYSYLLTDAGQKYIAEQNASKNAQTQKLSYLQQQLDAVNAALENAVASNDEVLTAQLQHQQANIQKQIENLNASYNATNKQLYVDAMKSKRDLPQALAALGYTGGLRESSLLGIDTDYAEQLNANEIARLSNIADIEAGANSDATDLYIAQLQANQDAQDTYTQRYLQVLQAMAEQEAAEKAAEEEAALEKATLMAKLGDNSAVYSLLGLSDPTATATATETETVNPTPAANPTPTPAANPTPELSSLARSYANQRTKDTTWVSLIENDYNKGKLTTDEVEYLMTLV